MKKFFFDTADIKTIETYWKVFKTEIPSSSMAGVTTNHNAFKKIGLNSLQEWKNRTI